MFTESGTFHFKWMASDMDWMIAKESLMFRLRRKNKITWHFGLALLLYFTGTFDVIQLLFISELVNICHALALAIPAKSSNSTTTRT